jgi:hypothetical protein
VRDIRIKDRIIKTDKGYFFDTETEHYIKLTDEICDVIEAPASDFQEEGERWETVEDLLTDMFGEGGKEEVKEYYKDEECK